MATFSYPDYAALLSGYPDIVTRLSGESLVFLFAALNELNLRYKWRNGVELLSDAEWDEIEGYLDKAARELMTNYCIGWIVPVTTALPEGMLECDGAQHLKADYPELMAVIDSAFLVDSTHFKTPDLRGHTVVGLGRGQYSAITFTMNQDYGLETVTLDINQIPSHEHGERHYTDQPSFVFTTNGVRYSIATGTGTNSTQRVRTDSAGGGSDHINMQPSIGLRYCLIAR